MREIKPYIFVATPMYEGKCFGAYTKSLINLFNKFNEKDYLWQYEFIFNESIITRARNTLVHYFLKQKNASHLLFIDADIEFDANDVVRMIEADKDIICGAYPAKYIDWTHVKKMANEHNLNEKYLAINSCKYLFNVENGDNTFNWGGDQIKEVKNAGTGFMLIKRNVFEKLKLQVPTYFHDTLFKDEKVYKFFDTAIEPIGNNLVSEDYNFCSIWKNAGGKIYIGEWVKLAHIGFYQFGKLIDN